MAPIKEESCVDQAASEKEGAKARSASRMKAGGANKRSSSSVKDQPAGKRHDAKERA